MKVDLPEDVWRSVEAAIADFMRFGPGDMESEYIPDEHLERARRAIAKATEKPSAPSPDQPPTR
jgi:hypothetical protein